MSMTARYLVGDVVQRMAEIPDGSIDLVVTSPPFLALRSYLPADHPDKDREIGSEATPAEFLDTMLGLTAEWGRVLAPHGSIAVELGDTFSGSGGAGGDYDADGLRSGQERFDGSARRGSGRVGGQNGQPTIPGRKHYTVAKSGDAWPLAKSLTGIPTLYTWSLAYGRNLLTGEESPAGQWRIRNLIAWARPNPPVGALGDKFRPATSYITVATRVADRWFDLDAVRGPGSPNTHARTAKGVESRSSTGKTADGRRSGNWSTLDTVHVTNGAPPLDWHTDGHPEDGDWLWKLPTAPYKGSHYAAFPPALPKRLIEAMCPRHVCKTCGEPRRRITDTTRTLDGQPVTDPQPLGDDKARRTQKDEHGNWRYATERTTTGWTVCDCSTPTYRRGVVLDPFAGSGTTLAVATGLGRDAIGIDIDARNADLAIDRVGPMILEVLAERLDTSTEGASE